MNTQTQAPSLSELDHSFFQRHLDGKGNCPGFNLWAVLMDNGRWYFIDGDQEGGAEVRLFFRSREASYRALVANRRTLPTNLVEAINLGTNPDVAAWDSFH